MTRLRRFDRIGLALFGFALASLMSGCGSMASPSAGGVQRLYVLYCGEAQIPDVSPWSPGFNVGQSAVFSDNCYLIQHGRDWMMWDSGYPDSLADRPEGIVGPRSRALRTKTLASQLAEIGVAPSQSATSRSRTRTATTSATATCSLRRRSTSRRRNTTRPSAPSLPSTASPGTYDRLRADRVVRLEGDFDVFGDGSVKILSTPGHTPGHQSLLVRLPKTGAVVLSGDAAHFRENFMLRRVPGFNYNVEQSRQSMDKLDSVVKAERAQLWINHDAKQNATIVHAPQFIQ